MAIVIFVEGVSVQGASPPPDRSPILSALVADGRAGRVAWPPGVADITLERPELFALFGVSVDLARGQDPPTGSLLARAAGLASDELRDWACLAFTHLRQVGAELRFVSIHQTGQSWAEVADLARALAPEFALEGWQVHADREGVLLLSTARNLQVRTHPLDRLAGRHALETLPTGPDAAHLLTLLTSGQMLLARHPRNHDRLAQGRVPLNTPWIWGIGRFAASAGMQPSARRHCFSAEPLATALAHHTGWQTHRLDDDERLPETLPATLLAAAGQEGHVLVHLHAPALLARHGLWERRDAYLRELEVRLCSPLAAAARADTVPVLLLSGPPLASDGAAVTTDPSPWSFISDARKSGWRRLWQKGRRSKGKMTSLHDFRRMWLP
ncbi:MAG: hypothetical protein HQL66_06030 [Magnetococcales bacterium]|nr:hypothetical protein [Magnetococcales bacterium]